MEALQAAIALSETVSVDSDTSKIMEGAADKAGGQRRRKQRAPMRSAFSSDTPSESQQLQQQAAMKQLQQQNSLQTYNSSGDSPVLNNNAGLEQAPAAAKGQHSSRSCSRSSPAQRQGPCGHCKTPYSPQWRKGPRNKPVLCNACGIRYLRNRHLGRAVPQKKRTTSGPRTAAGTDSTGPEGSVDTLTDSADMLGPSKKRRTKQAELADEDTSNYSFDGSVDSVGDLQQYLQQEQHHHEYHSAHAAAAGRDTAGGASSDVTEAVPAVSTGQDGSARQDAAASAPYHAAAAAQGSSAFGTSITMPGNMQPLLVPMNSVTGGNLYGGSYNMALALQLYQQQQQQQLLYGQQHLLVTQGSSGGAAAAAVAALPANGSFGGASNGGSSSGGTAPQGDSSQTSSPVLSSNSTGRVASAPAALLYTQSLQMQQLQGYLLQQQQHQQQAQLLQAAGMLHGPSPLSVMSSANIGNLCLGNTASLGAMLQAPASTAAAAATAANASTNLEIAPLLCGDKPSAGNPAPAAAPANVPPSVPTAAM